MTEFGSGPLSLVLYAHPFSSYCWKVLIALYENATPFEYKALDPEKPANYGELLAQWPYGKFPLLVDGGKAVAESSVIIEHLDLRHPGAVRMVPADSQMALDVRMMDRVFDNYVMTPMNAVVLDAMRPEDAKSPAAVADARKLLDTSYAWLDQRMASRTWGCGDAFGLADCAAAPSLFYADWVHPISESHGHLRGYRARLLARPSVKRAVDEARPYRKLFPPGAPDRD